MNLQEKQNYCETTLAVSSVSGVNGCFGVSIFTECPGCRFYYVNSEKTETERRLLSKPIADQK